MQSGVDFGMSNVCMKVARDAISHH